MIETTAARDGGARRTLALVCAIFLGAGTILAGVGPVLPHLAARTGQDLAALGGLFTAISAGVVLSQFVFGPLSDRFGLPRVLAGGMLLMPGGIFGVTLSTALPAVLACGLLAGFGFGGVLVGGNLLIAQLFASRSAAALNGANVFFGIGSVLGPTIAGIAGAWFGAPHVALWAGAALVLILGPVVLLAAATPARAGAAGGPGAGAAAGAGTLWLLGLLLLVYTGTEIGFGGWVTVYLLRGASLAQAEAALAASGFWLALTFGRVLATLFGMRAAPTRLLTLSLLGLLAGAALLLLGGGARVPAIAGVLLLGLSCGPVFPTTLSMITSFAGGSGARASLALGVGNSGGLFFPALLGLVLSRYGPSAMAAMVLGEACVMLALYAVVTLSGGLARPHADAGAAGD